MQYKDWNIQALTGYEPKTTFYMDFSIADAFGESAIRDTYNRAFKAWSDDIEFMTELVMVLNWKSWEHYEKNPRYSRLYVELYYQLRDFCLDTFEGDDLSYFIRTTD